MAVEIAGSVTTPGTLRPRKRIPVLSPIASIETQIGNMCMLSRAAIRNFEVWTIGFGGSRTEPWCKWQGADLGRNR